MQKGSAQIFSLVTVIAVILVGIFINFTKNENSSLLLNPTAKVVDITKTYTNSRLGFEFTYPNELTAKEDTEEEFNQRGNGDFRKNFKNYVTYEPGKFLGAVVVLGKDNSYEMNPFTFWVFENLSDLSIDAWYKNYWYYPFVWGDYTYKGKVELAPKDMATVSGQLTKSGIIDYQPGKPKFVYFTKGEKMYLFRIIGEEGNKILESFKF